MTILEFMNGHKTADIVCPLKHVRVRHLEVKNDNEIEVTATAGDTIVESVTVATTTELRYEPWVFDRGSIIFDVPSMGTVKLCTELDKMTFEDGTTVDALLPDDNMYGGAGN